MNDQLERRMKILRLLGRMDTEYEAIEKEYQKLEKAFSKMVNNLPSEQQDIAWAFVCTSDALDHRLLEIACELIDLNRI